MTSPAQRAARLGDLAWRFSDIEGVRFGRLLVIKRNDVDVSGHVRWKCLCDCGATVVISGTSLRLGITKSCGCFMRASRKERGRALRFMRLSFRKALCITRAFENELGIDRLRVLVREALKDISSKSKPKSTRKL